MGRSLQTKWPLECEKSKPTVQADWQNSKYYMEKIHREYDINDEYFFYSYLLS